MEIARHIGRQRSTELRIVALLLGLAAIAERAACRPLPVRLVVAWLLGRAECAALTLLDPPGDPIAAPAQAPQLAGWHDLIALAIRLRVLAAVVAQACGAPCGSAETAPAAPAPAGRRIVAGRARRPRPRDTS